MTPEPVLPSLSVVIPTTSGGPDLETCLRSLSEQDYASLEVIVVDNAAPVSLRELPQRFSGLRLLRNDVNRGFAEACNQGISASSGELVLLLNDDTKVEPRGLETLVMTLVGHPRWGACQAKLLLMDDPARLDTAGSFLTRTGFLVHRGAYGPENLFRDSDEIFAAKGAALLIRRRALAEVGAFDSDFFAYFEESDLCWRLWLSGWEVGFAAEARVRHRLGSTASKLLPAFIQFHSFKNRICSLLKNLGAARLAWMLPYHLVLCVGIAAWFTVNGRRDIGGAILRAIAWNVRRLPRTLRKRAAIQGSRRVDDRTLMPRITMRTSARQLFGYAQGTVRTRDDT
jgi:GT2 family glycosyltransferase